MEHNIKIDLTPKMHKRLKRIQKKLGNGFAETLIDHSGYLFAPHRVKPIRQERAKIRQYDTKKYGTEYREVIIASQQEIGEDNKTATTYRIASRRRMEYEGHQKLFADLDRDQIDDDFVKDFISKINDIIKQDEV